LSAAFNYGDLAGDDPKDLIASEETSTTHAASAARFDVCPTWLDLAIRHLSDAGAAQVSRVAEYRGADGIAQVEMLQWEFEASLQAIVACGIAVKAFGAAIQSKAQLPQSVSDEWQRQGTPPYIQISEVLRRAFGLDVKSASGVRQCLREILRFHDLAIDPSQKTDTDVFHPGLGDAVEWRFAYFRYENALLIVRATLRLIWELVTLGKPFEVDVQKYVHGLRPKVEPLQNSVALKEKRY